jgi:hypothetical protein
MTATRSLDLHLLLWCGLVVLGHALYLDTPFVNQEFAFCEAAHSLREPAYRLGIDKYWEIQANPLGYALVLAVFGLDTTFWSARLPALAGCLLLLLAGRLGAGRLGLRPGLFSLWAGVTAFNPLLWLYTGQATADVLPVGLLALAFWFCYAARARWPLHLLGGLCFGLAALIKFPALLVGLGFIYLLLDEARAAAWKRRARFTGALCCYSLLPAALLGIYFLFVWHNYHVMFIADRFKAVHFAASYLGSFVPIFAAYVSYLALALGPLALACPLRLGRVQPRGAFLAVLALALALALAALPLLANFQLGEMDFGGLGRAMPAPALTALRAGGVALAVFIAADLGRAARRSPTSCAGFALCAVLPFLLICALSRPAQRYLLFCLPILLFYLVAAGGRATVILGWLSLALWLPIDALAAGFQVAQGQAAERMAQWVIGHGYRARVQPGSIYQHAGQHFPHLYADSPEEYAISTQPPPAVQPLHVEPVQLLGRVIYSFYLYPTPPRPLEKGGGALVAPHAPR